MTATVHPPEEILLGFARALRASGVPVAPDRAQSYLDAVALVGLADMRATYWAGRATLCSTPDDLHRYDQVFDTWFNQRAGRPCTRLSDPPPMRAAAMVDSEDGEDSGDLDHARAAASAAEVLRHRDVADLSAHEKRRLGALFASLHVRVPVRSTARHEPWRRGSVDASRTLRRSLQQLGEPAAIAWRRRRLRPAGWCCSSTSPAR